MKSSHLTKLNTESRQEYGALLLLDQLMRYELPRQEKDKLQETVVQLEEEVVELIDAIEKNSNKVHEAADVLYHLMVLLEANGIKIEDVMDELKKRQK